ncbi:DUF4386 domain-containing protein [Zobellia galactanivorans]|uniref:Conserved hypothetical membrane protein n=1 Tax=Zobellia galactanivorans (strain DSM 12802 / CCUG 47099 / CIP 106680 / NCIMB 13871 / Dsij) TaxID=63186 RepID=G0L048_ZOBGA|nr:DUF4386 domain-containing protein [Zobellia galactanivorans]CAZ97367.1 Conserved hypothetical membrane protein [Zobellia galactanivorans]
MEYKQISRIAGVLIFIGIITGILSVVPSVDSEKYLEIVYPNKSKILIGALFQFLLIPIYIGFSLILYPILKQGNNILSIGFVGFRFMAGVFQLIGIILLPSFIILSEKYSTEINFDIKYYETTGQILQLSRDLVNHLGVILATGLGNLFLYRIFYKEKNIPIWLSVWGVIGNILIMAASFLILFQRIKVVSIEYLILTTPLLVQEIILAIWLIKKGLKNPKTSNSNQFNPL